MKKNTCIAPLLVLVCMYASSLVHAQGGDHDSILKTDGTRKLDMLYQWYYHNVRQYDSSKAIQAFNTLQDQADQAGDKVCLAAVAFYRGQYIAVKLNNDALGIDYMQQGISMAEKNGQELQVAEYQHHFGYYYFFHTKEYAKALSYMTRANYIFQHAGYGQIKEQGYLLYQLAFVHYHLGNYHEALKHLKTALQYPIDHPTVEIFILNTTGQCFRELFQTDSARQYFLLAKDKAVAVKDTTWVGITSGNIGNLYLNRHDYAAALPFMQDYYKYSVIAKDSACITEALIGLADIDIFYGNHDRALGRLQQADTVYHTKFGYGNVEVENYERQGYLYNAFAHAWEGKGNAAQALHYRKLADEVRDSIDRRARLSNGIAIQQLLEAEHHSNEIKLLENEKRTAQLKQYFLVAAVALLGIVFLLVYNRQLLKRKRDRALQEKQEAMLQSEKKNVEANLQHAQATLNSYTENLRQKTELLEKVQTEIQQLREQQGVELDGELLFLQQLNDSTILTELQWQEFRDLFEKVHAGFFVKLKYAYPQLTPAETRLCTLTKLQLGTKEMAAMLGVGTETIKKTRQRLRKKIGIPEETGLETVLEKL